MQREALQTVRVCDARKDDVRDARVDEIEVCQVLNRRGLERAVP